MKIHTLIILIIILSSCSVKKESNSSKTNYIVDTFQKIEDEMEKHYEYIEKEGIFEDPLGRIDYFFRLVRSSNPQLLTDTKLYKEEILNLLTDSVLRQNRFTHEDIIYTLYNLAINDYVDLLESALNLYKKGKMSLSYFELFLFQEDVVSNSIYKNYKNKKLQGFLSKLLLDKEVVLKAETEDRFFKEKVMKLKDGTFWEGSKDSPGLKPYFINNMPILDYIREEL